MIRVGVIGAGFGRTVHVPALRRAGADVLGPASRDWLDLVSDPRVDAVTIATPPDTHAPIALAAIEAGKSVLCEKPLAHDAAVAAAMRDAAIARGVVHFTGFEFREIAAFAEAQQLVAAGAVGDVTQVDVAWVVHSWRNPERPWSWRADAAQGGGTLGALGAHVFDYVEWIAGPVRTVSARLETRVERRPDQAGVIHDVTAEDHCKLRFELENGAPGSAVLSMVAPESEPHVVRVHGREGVLTITNEGASDYASGFRLWRAAPGSTDRRLVVADPDSAGASEDGRIEPFARLARRFVEAIACGDLSRRPSFVDGARAQLLADGARLSALKQRPVNVSGVAV